jgi:hypothetical protein
MIDNATLDAIFLEHDEKAIIARLAALGPLQYDRQRSRAAEELGVSVSALDKAVKEARASEAHTKGQGRPLELPNIEPWDHPVNGAELLDDICKAIGQYVVLPEGSADAMALWALHTHVFDCFNHSPRLAVTSPSPIISRSVASARRTAPPRQGPSIILDRSTGAFPPPSSARNVRWIATGVPSEPRVTSATIAGHLPPDGCRNPA